MPIEFQKWIRRQDLRDNPDKYYVFGDNVERVGMGGQAREMRGEPNAIGVCTKWSPGMDEADFFADDNYSKELEKDIVRITELHREGHTLVIPSDGLGTGLSMLPTKAPHIYWAIYKIVEMLNDGPIPWEKPTKDPMNA